MDARVVYFSHLTPTVYHITRDYREIYVHLGDGSSQMFGHARKGKEI